MPKKDEMSDAIFYSSLAGVALVGTVVVAALFFGGGRTEVDDTQASIQQQKICKATIAGIMGRSPQIITAKGSGTIYLSYTREDGSYWDYNCQVSGNKVVWRAPEGRWRNTSLDPKLSYNISGDQIVIAEEFADGSASQYRFQMGDL